jgi:hypothetical protein
MRRTHLITGLMLALAAAPYSFAQRPPLLPDQFGAWSKGFCPAKPVATVLAEETGLIDNVACQFSSNGQSVGVWAGSFRDPSSGYEVYTSEISPGMEPSTLGQNSAIDRDKLLMLVGNVVLRVEHPRDVPAEDLQQLIAALRAHADQTPLPPIRAYLPQGFTDGTQRYARGPVAFRNALASLKQDEFASLVDKAGFNLSAEAMFAYYRAGKNEAVLLLIAYPTQQLAEQHLRHLEQAISSAERQAGTRIERKASLLSLVLRPSSPAYGDSLQKAVNYETAVTWNEPHQTITDPPILSTLAKIIILTGAFMVVAVVLGLAFGGVRVMAKIFFPGKFFDRPEQMDVLQLGLSGKRIDSRDFY